MVSFRHTIGFLAFFLMILSLTSCRKEFDPLFTMNMEAEFEIPAGLSSILTHTFIIRDIKNPLPAYLETFGVDTSQINSIQAGRGELSALFSSTNYEFVNKVSVWMVSPDNADYRKELYYLDFNTDNDNDYTLRLLSSIANVKDLLENDTFNLEVKLEFRGFSPRLIENRLIFNLIAIE